ncbi:hypothetical protein BAUCODRAFT_127082 [Baudoinia panamericana UAMH 10762]|uniref:Major facilitator superfamily (MFS) profile domain-containing protein n=1 Tax=Baudoinia panamericana (strain UAMH 10762) TaxID=717646 RepID=M2MIR8_BAUPA|nr:uncharacterized protein BAUCODRAFT_127082 [Baudoinia panamericana UAMH 10762]EMC91163.1 hypothetical protein BAUCODRAFT_127082 [Baudoinia panamericana UAMH 10762]
MSYEEREEQLNKVYRRIDVRLLSWYLVVTIVVRIAARNITNVAILNVEQGTDMKRQLGGLTSNQWAWILSSLSYCVLLFDPISTMLLKYCSPRLWISRILFTWVTFWGVISMCQAATQTFSGLLACRILLGLAEAGLLPCVLFHITFWYPASKLPFRVALLSVLGQFSGLISGLLAFAISYMNGIGGLAGWRWMFLFEGLPVISLGIASFFHLPNYPDTAPFLSGKERQLILDEFPKSQPSPEADTWTWWQFVLIYACHAIGGYGISLILPNIIMDLGLRGSRITQLTTMPPSALGCLLLLSIAWRIHEQKCNPWLSALTLESLTCGCYISLITVRNAVGTYIIMCIALVCTIGVLPLLWPERIRTANGTTSTGLAVGVTATMVHLLGVVGPHIYNLRFRPRYSTSYSVALGLLAVSLFSMVCTWTTIRRRDAKARAERAESTEL